MKSVDLMSLWAFVCSVLLCKSVRKRRYPRYEIRPMRLAAEFFLSQSTQSSRSFLAHVSSPQKAFGIQRTQSVSAIVDTDKEAKSSLHPPHMGISVITPLPFGGGVGGGAAIFMDPVCSVLLCNSVRKRTHPLDEIRPMRLAGEFFLSQSTQSSRSFLAHCFDPTEGLRHTEFTEAFQLLSLLIRDITKPTSSP